MGSTSARQLISTHHGGLTNCPNGRMVGHQPLKEVVWQGRNQAVHYEEDAPRQQVINCFNQLKADFGPQFEIANTPPKNLAPQVVELLGWDDIDRFEADMRAVLNLPAI